MRTCRTTCLIVALAMVSLAGPAFSSGRGDLRGRDTESAARRDRRDAEWLRQARVRPVTGPAALRASSSREVSDLLDSWLRREKTPAPRPVEPPAPAGAAAVPPRH